MRPPSYELVYKPINPSYIPLINLNVNPRQSKAVMCVNISRFRLGGLTCEKPRRKSEGILSHGSLARYFLGGNSNGKNDGINSTYGDHSENPHLDCETHPCFMGMKCISLGESAINIHKSSFFMGNHTSMGLVSWSLESLGSLFWDHGIMGMGVLGELELQLD